jgi:hypothetical protein
MDLTRDRGALHLDAGLQMLRQLGHALARRGQLAVGLQARQAVTVGLDRVAHRRRQPRDVVLQ